MLDTYPVVTTKQKIKQWIKTCIPGMTPEKAERYSWPQALLAMGLLQAYEQTKDKTAVSPEQMIKLTDDLREEFDYVLLDCPAGIEQGFKNAIAGADKALVVTTPEVSAIRDADRIIGLLEANEIRDISLIINRLRPDMIARGDMMSVDDVTDILAVDLIGTILDDEQIVIATNQGEPLSGKSSQAEEEYMNICKRLLGEEIPFADINRKQGLLRKIGSFFKK